MKTLQNKIKTLRELERKANEKIYKTKNEMKLMETKGFNQLELKWISLYDELKTTPEFAEDCKNRGCVTDYNFSDVLA